ncbi:MAG: hypothetical protein ACK5KU_08560 [Beutenbergiaceae bacterium]
MVHTGGTMTAMKGALVAIVVALMPLAGLLDVSDPDDVWAGLSDSELALFREPIDYAAARRGLRLPAKSP